MVNIAFTGRIELYKITARSPDWTESDIVDRHGSIVTGLDRPATPSAAADPRSTETRSVMSGTPEAPPPLSPAAAAAAAPSQPGIVPLTYLSGAGAGVVAAVGLVLIAVILAYALGLMQWISTR